jgi:hypothetical protein
LRAEAYGSAFFRALAYRALGLAHILQGTAAEAVPLMEQGLPWVAAGGLAHQVEANYLAVLAEVYLAAGRDADAERVADAGIESAQRSRSRVWEIRAWIAWLQLPPTAARRAKAEKALARIGELIETSGAEGFRPGYWLARAHWADNAADRARARAEALAAFERIGADGHVERGKAIAA